MVILLINLNGTFLFIIGLFVPLMHKFLVNLLCFNRKFISNYKKYLLKYKIINEFMRKEILYTPNNSKCREMVKSQQSIP